MKQEGILPWSVVREDEDGRNDGMMEKRKKKGLCAHARLILGEVYLAFLGRGGEGEGQEAVRMGFHPAFCVIFFFFSQTCL